jgi:hypothetical protein
MKWWEVLSIEHRCFFVSLADIPYGCPSAAITQTQVDPVALPRRSQCFCNVPFHFLLRIRRLLSGAACLRPVKCSVTR